MADIVLWMYNSNTGAIGPFLAPQTIFLLHSGLGWHGTFGSKDEALAYYNANKDKNPGWKAPTQDAGTAISNAGSTAVNDATQAITGQSFKNLNLQVWFLRIGEIILGVILIGVGVAKLTGVGNVVTKLPPIIPI